MTTAEARKILLLYRPGVDDGTDPEMAEALALAKQDPELAIWFARQCGFHQAVRAKLRAAQPPTDLRERLLAQQKVVRPGFWQGPPIWLAAAAVFALLLGISAVLLRPTPPDRFADFRTRMVTKALRQYGMDITNSSMTEVRQFMSRRGAPADYEITPGLGRLQLTGGGFLQWRGHPVAMVCFERHDKELLYLFVLQRDALKDAPDSTPKLEKVNKLFTVSWSKGDKAYILAGPEETEFEKKYP
jgi:hypothetical protein